jgi:hypothetical protein
MTDDLKLPPGREPLRSDWFIEQLGNSQQKVMSLTVQVRELKKRIERAEILEELVMDVVADIKEAVPSTAISERIFKVMQKLEWGEDD